MIFIIPIIIGVAVSAISLAVADATQEENKEKVRHHKRVENDLIAKYTELQRQFYELQDRSKNEINELHSINKENRDNIQAFIDVVRGLKLAHEFKDKLSLVREKIIARPSHQLINHYIDAVKKTNALLLELKIDLVKVPYDNLLTSLEECAKNGSLSRDLLPSELSTYFSLFESKRIEIENSADLDEIKTFYKKHIPNLISKIQGSPLTGRVLEYTIDLITNTSPEVRLIILNSLSLPMSVINSLSLHQDDEVRESIASIDLSQKPSDGKEQYAYILERLSKDKSPKVRIAIVSNTSTSLMTLSQLCEDYDYDVRKSLYERLISILQKDSTIIQIFDLNMLRIILEFIDSQNQILPSIVSHLDYLIRIDKLPNRFLEEIVNVTNEEICNQIIQSIEIPELVLNKLATDKKREIRISVASLDVSQKSSEYQKIYTSTLDILSRDKSDKVRMRVSDNSYTAFSTLMRLCEDSNFDIQKNVYQRLISMMQKDMNLTELFDLKTLKIMLDFSGAFKMGMEAGVKAAVIGAVTALPFSFLRNALRVSRGEITSDEAALEIPIVIENKDSQNKNFKTLTENDLPLLMNILTKQIDSKICSCTNIKDILKKSSKFIRASIASVVNLPEAILIDLSKDKEEIVRKSLLSNPSLKGEALKNLATDNSRIIRTNVIYHPNFSASLLFDLSIVEIREAIEFTKRTYGELQKLYKQYKK